MSSSPSLSVNQEELSPIRDLLDYATNASTRTERMRYVEELFLYFVLHPTPLVLTPRLRDVVQKKLKETETALENDPVEQQMYQGLERTVQALQQTLQAIALLPQYVA
jgi:uncharacterized protein involved in exopolysaccharide biosynthesis